MHVCIPLATIIDILYMHVYTTICKDAGGAGCINYICITCDVVSLHM